MQDNFSSEIVSWIAKYETKNQQMSDEDWLAGELERHLGISEKEAQSFSHEAQKVIQASVDSKRRLQKAHERGMNSDEWLYRELQQTSSGLSSFRFGEYLTEIDHTIAECNRQWEVTLFTKDGRVNQNPQLHGFIFEQQQANSFNMDAALKGESVRAEVLRPDPGQTYGKNSPDIRLSDGTEYQAKASSSPLRTQALLDAGNYGEQQGLVPEGQGVLGKSTETIAHGDASSKATSYEDIKTTQHNAQQEDILPENTWNDYTNKELAFSIAKEAGVNALYGAAAGALFVAGRDIYVKGEIDGQEVAIKAIQSGATSGAVTIVTGVLKVGIEKKIIPWPQTPPPLPGTFSAIQPSLALPVQAHVLAAIATTAVESVSVAYKVSQGELTARQGVEALESTAVSTCAGLALTTEGVAMGTTIGAVLGPWGAAVGAVVGGTLAYAAGSAVGRMVAKGGQMLRDAACKVVSTAVKAVGSVVSSVKNICASVFSW